MAYCPSCGKEVSATDIVCEHCGEPIAHVSSSLSYAGTSKPKEAPNTGSRPSNAHEIACPSCGRKSDSIKRYTMFKSCLYLGCYMKWQMVTYTCCPDCMRKKILDEGVFTSKIITANLFWLFVILPWAVIQLFMCGQKGHSKGVAQ